MIRYLFYSLVINSSLYWRNSSIAQSVRHNDSAIWIKGTELAWFKSYLSNRTKFVSYDGTNSCTLSITTGVHQDSILGPLLLIIYMNDIHNASTKFHAILFPYDTNLTSTLFSFDVNIDNNCNRMQLSANINRELKNIQIWLEINKLSLNVKITKFMIFHHKQRNIENLIPHLNLNEQLIEQVTEFNFLGLTIDQHLTRNEYVQKLECGTWYHHPRRLQCVLSRNLRIFKVATWHYRCRHNLKNNCIWDHFQYCLLVPRSSSKPVMLTIDLESRKVLFIEIVFWHV